MLQRNYQKSGGGVARKINRKRAGRLFDKILDSDRQIAKIRSSVSDKQERIQLIKNVIKQRKKGSTKADRLFVRVGIFNNQARERAKRSIRKSGSQFSVKIGGKLRGKIFKFDSKSLANKAIIKHYNSALRKSLGRNKAKEARTLFR